MIKINKYKLSMLQGCFISLLISIIWNAIIDNIVVNLAVKYLDFGQYNKYLKLQVDYGFHIAVCLSIIIGYFIKYRCIKNPLDKNILMDKLCSFLSILINAILPFIVIYAFYIFMFIIKIPVD